MFHLSSISYPFLLSSDIYLLISIESGPENMPSSTYPKNKVFPLENRWEERIQICNLYPLLVHVNLFGGGYINQVKNILSYYVA